MRKKSMEMEFPKSKFESSPSKSETVTQIVEKFSAVSEKENENWSLKELEGCLTEAFREAGEEALKENDGTIYTTLSGGLDSSLALAFLRKNFPEARIVTITMGGDQEHPDVIHARLAAQKFHSEHQEIIPTKDDIADAIREYREKFPEIDPEKATEEGDFDVYLLYKNISKLNPKALIVHDGIDELTGGYWGHRKDEAADARKKAFLKFWNNLIPGHLKPLLATSRNFNIQLIFPYLQEKLIKYISEIPINDRVSSEMGKKPMREIAKTMEVPEQIITRSKRGQVGMLDIEKRRNKL